MRPVALLLLALSCGEPQGSPCTATPDCEGMAVCLDDRCVDVDCRASTDCDLEQFCDPETFTCEDGCASSEDCRVGERCDVTTATCIPRGCQDTQLDCELGERCDLATSTCQPDPDPHCARCFGDEECGPGGVCGRLASFGPAYCFLPCSPEAFDPCPAGLQCTGQTTDPDEPANFLCIGQCDG